MTGWYSVGGSTSVQFQLRNGVTNIGGFTRASTISSAIYSGGFFATGAANALWFISSCSVTSTISRLELSYGSAQYLLAHRSKTPKLPS